VGRATRGGRAESEGYGRKWGGESGAWGLTELRGVVQAGLWCLVAAGWPTRVEEAGMRGRGIEEENGVREGRGGRNAGRRWGSEGRRGEGRGGCVELVGVRRRWVGVKGLGVRNG